MAIPSLASGIDHELAEHQNTLVRLADGLRKIMANKMIAKDAQADRILNRILQSRDAVEIDRHMDDLLVRVGEIIAERTGDASELKHLGALTGPRGSAMTKRARQSSQNTGKDLSMPARTFMKL
jgi:hypothetical protein